MGDFQALCCGGFTQSSQSLCQKIVSSTNSDSLLRSFKLAESMGHAVRQGRKARLGYKEICGAETLSQQSDSLILKVTVGQLKLLVT